MKKIKGSDRIGYMYDYITIYWTHFEDKKEVQEGKCIKKIVNFEFGEEMPTFNDIIKLAKEYGYTDDDVLHLNADSTLKGIAYCYNNYQNEWYVYGETRGYV